jgi:beta-glucosidase
MDPRLFPNDFLWGASTASHQVEGGMVNDWSEWELAHAKGLARTAAKRLSWLPSWKSIRAQAQDPHNYVSGKGVDHYRRYEEDFDLLKDLHMNSFRFGIEWARIEPKEGAWNPEALRHYHKYIKSLRARKIEPILNIWHWTMPTWFAAKGGFEKKSNLAYFDQFVQKIIEEFGHEIRYVITLNEPNVYAALGYLNGERPPQTKSLKTFLKVYWNLTRAHRRAYVVIKRIEPAIQVGVAMNMANNQPKQSRNPLSPLAASAANYAWNRWFLNRTRKQQDFIGINYYTTNYYHGFGYQNPTTPLNDLGWYMEPEGIFPVLMQTHAYYKKPIIICENGVADANDRYRKWWIEQTLVAVQRALSQGVQVRGYLHWSLLDNFEWSYGWWPKFGLVEVDRKHGMKRTIRPSAKWFAHYLAKLQRFQAVQAKAHGRYDDE